MHTLAASFTLKGKKIDAVEHEQFENVIEAAARILNSYLKAYDSSSYSLPFVGEDDYIGAINAMRFRIRESKRLLEKWKNQTSSSKRYPEIFFGSLSLRVLRCLACTPQTNLLSLFSPGVSGKEAVLTQGDSKVFIGF